MLWYADTSALVKLTASEKGSLEFAAVIHDRGLTLATCVLSLTELLRATGRKGPDEVGEAREVLRKTTMLQLTVAVLESAGRLQPTTLRSLDAIHVASALSLRESCEGVITYDRRMAEAARTNGLTVLSPGSTEEL